MTEAKPRTTIVVTIGERAVRLSSAERWRQAIRSGDLTGDSEVQVERPGAPPVRCLARDASELQALLPTAPTPPIANGADLDATEAAPPTAASSPVSPLGATADPPANPVATSAAPAGAASVAPPSPTLAGGLATAADTGAGPLPPRRKHSAGGKVAVVLALLVVLLLLQLSRCADDQDAARAERTLYAERDVRVRSAPSIVTGRELAMLSRGAAVRVGSAEDATQGFVTVTAGANRGGFVWAAYLSEAPPPALSGSPRRVRLRAGSVLRAAPSRNAPVVEELAAGPVEVAGEVADGWLELRHSDAGVAYVEATSVSRRPGRRGVSVEVYQ